MSREARFIHSSENILIRLTMQPIIFWNLPLKFVNLLIIMKFEIVKVDTYTSRGRAKQTLTFHEIFLILIVFDGTTIIVLPLYLSGMINVNAGGGY